MGVRIRLQQLRIISRSLAPNYWLRTLCTKMQHRIHFGNPVIVVTPWISLGEKMRVDRSA